MGDREIGERGVHKKARAASGWGRPLCRLCLGVLSGWENYVQAFLTLSTMALKAAGLFTARSARTLRLISMPALWMRPMSFE